ncbi:DUF3108 domain-containing protein [Spirosoma sp. KCTC 42546]|uniref:DUF3108 domain-containing protein n=1 Tax=Spirosoma sp. KCTC 42546 TaxID=2520506 RepID=UPI00115849BE|nr:DUF3108 domain-containing protein [Spirosoma sp. KCTC 42546]QDK82721.1 DUF3108 domain-containing protein [Spirosoma sp. KCTC 42546]
MKKLLIGIGILSVMSTGFMAMNTYRRVQNNSFGPGEHLEYRVHYGFLNAAEAVVDVSPTVYKVNERPCYRVNVDGRTVGAFDLVTRIRDTWRSYIDTSAILPQKFYSNLQENSYRKEENITFNHEANTVKAEERTERDIFKVPDNVHDFISGYYFLRTFDFNRISNGQIIELPAFYDDTVYNMKVRYRGKDVVKTKFGKINVIKLNPVLPQNKLFKDEESIRIFVSDDTNKVPVKVEVDLWVGSMVMDLKQNVGLKQALKFF